MFSIRTPFHLLSIFILLTVVVQLCHTLANQAVYIIENIGSKQVSCDSFNFNLLLRRKNDIT